MSSNADILSNLRAILEGAEALVTHPDFEAAKQEFVENSEEIGNISDVSDEIVLLCFLQESNLEIDGEGRLASDSVLSEPAVWVDGEWQDRDGNTRDEDEDEDEDEEEEEESE